MSTQQINVVPIRKCSKCGSEKTYTRKSGYEQWYNSKIDSNLICSKCHDKEYSIVNREKRLESYKRHNKKRHPKRINFKGKMLQLSKDPRTGICSKCKKSVHKGEIKRTNMHHSKYDPENPLEHTIELCVSCHNKEHPERYLWGGKK